MTLRDSLADTLIDGFSSPDEDDRLPWREWLAATFPSAASAPMPEGGRHARLWEWFEALRAGVAPRARIEGWPRGGGKSSSAELGCCRLAQTLQRRFVLYVSGTQAQADGHVQTIGAWMEQAGIDRAVGRYGQARGWSRQQLQAAGGFTVAAYGLDTASRGIKVQEYRPDLIILDDVDSEDDSPLVIKSKINAITLSILPTGAPDLAVLFVQNPMHEDSVWTQLHDGRAKFLLDRDVFDPEPAIEGLQYTSYQDEEGRLLFKIVGGVPTWEGQPLEACERLMNLIGEQAFMREAQHRLDAGDRHYVFMKEGVAYLRSILPLLVDPDHEAEDEWREGHAEFYPAGRDGLAGHLDVWQRPERGHRYVIGADVAEGLQKEETDESTADILDLETWEQVASYHGKPDPRSFAYDLNNLSVWYNRAEIIPENNSFGVEVVRNLDDLGANVWENNPEQETEGTEDADQSAGMRTGPRTKGLVDAGLVSTVIDAAKGRRSILLNSRRVVEQLIHYVYLPNRKRGGEGRWHDDAVRSIGLAWYIAKDYGLRPPVEAQQRRGNVYGGGSRGGRR